MTLVKRYKTLQIRELMRSVFVFNQVKKESGSVIGGRIRD
jgi:hypothetical protein